MKLLKQWLPDVLAVLFFAIVAFAYFYPAVVEDRVLNQGDISAGIGSGQEQSEYLKKTGERTRWTNSLFSGMPTYQMAPSYSSTNTLTAIESAYHLWLPDNVWYVFVYLLGFYILLRAFDFRWHLAALGSVLWAFSTYFLIIIAAGHLWKVMALAYLPPMIAGVVLAFRGRYLWGLIVTALFGALEIHANHLQMTYYYLLPIILMVLAFIIENLWPGKTTPAERVRRVGLALCTCILGALIAVLVNGSNLYHTWQYSKETMRGKSELVKADSANQTSSGLERSYITDYSYGIGETWTLLIPNAKGGTSTRALGDNESVKEEGGKHSFNVGGGQTVPYSYFFSQMPQYWEESMEVGSNGTMGPVYVGAFVMFLFFLGLFIVRGPLKFCLLAATVLSIMLAWGKNYMGLTDFFIDYVPMYAKFRAVESILVIAEFTIPLLAMLALREVVKDPEVLIRKVGLGAIWALAAGLFVVWGVFMHHAAYYWIALVMTAMIPVFRYCLRETYTYPVIAPLYLALLFTAGFCLLFALMPGVFFNFYTNAEYANFSQMLPVGDLAPFMESLSRARQGVFTADCWRSLIIIIIGVALLMLYRAKKLKALPLVGLLVVLCLVDLWQVNKRYLNDEMFKPRKERQQIRPLTPADREILADPALYYRVLNLNGNVFNENETSYYHKSVGGYHAAKLRRYQELIEAYISPQQQAVRQAIGETNGDLMQVDGDSLWNVLNMLNTKYFLMANAQEPEKSFSVQNPYAMGNAWFVDEVRYVDNANQELDGLKNTDLRRVAVADKQFRTVLGEAAVQDSTAVVELTDYEPNELKYSVKSNQGGVLVFSEIHYPGWEATIDGQPAEIGRVDYVLRAVRITPGQHEVVLSFFPKTLDTTETMAYIALALLALLVVLLLLTAFRKTKRSALHTILFLGALAMFSSCEKVNVGDGAKKGSGEANLVLNVVTTGNEGLTRADGSTFWTRLNFVVYQNGKKVKGVNQSEGDDEFGQAALTLDEGTYQVLVLAHSADGNPTLTSAEKIQFTNALGYSDTFCYYGSIAVTSEPQTHNITLNRVTALLRFIVNDDMPSNVSNLKFYYTGGSGALNATTGLGCVDSKQTVIIVVDPKTQTKPYTFDLYTIPRETTANLNLTVTAYDETQTVVRERTFKGVEVQQNKITEFSGDFFTEGGENDNPNGEEPKTPGQDTFRISANTEWAGTITKSY